MVPFDTSALERAAFAVFAFIDGQASKIARLGFPGSFGNFL
jgi:hypothetical protein